MKKLLTILLVFTLFVSGASIASAQETHTYDYKNVSDTDRKAILENQDAILFDINQILKQQGVKDAAIDTIHFDEFIKIYIDTPVFDYHTATEEELKHTLSQGNYVYDWKVTHSGITLEVTLAIGPELTPEDEQVLSPEEKKEITKNAGKWGVSAIAVPGSKDTIYPDAMAARDFSAYDDVVIAGGVPGLRQPAAIGFKDHTAQDIILLAAPTAYAVTDYLPAARSASSDSVYDFQQIGQIAREHFSTLAPDEAGGEGDAALAQTGFQKLPVILVLCAAGILILLGIFLIRKAQPSFPQKN